MRAVTLFIVVLALPASLLADGSRIEGAFGIELGQQIDPESLPGSLGLERDTSNNDEVVYFFTPQHPYEPLSEYSVYVTPSSHKVYRIQALGHFKKRPNCVEELNTLDEMLTRKYGKKNFDASLQFTDLDKINFGKGARRIIASCSGYFTKHKLKLVYVDNELAKLVRKERRGKVQQDAIKRGERDASGL